MTEEQKKEQVRELIAKAKREGISQKEMRCNIYNASKRVWRTWFNKKLPGFYLANEEPGIKNTGRIRNYTPAEVQLIFSRFGEPKF